MFKKYKPSKYLCYLYFLLPIVVMLNTYSNKESDVWFLLSYGRKVLTSGFPKYDFLSMHSNLSFVMQQWLSAVSFYFVYKVLGGTGLFLLVFGVNLLIMYFLYKLCMLITDNKVFNSVITVCVIDILLQTFFLVPRPFLYSLLLFIIIIYILELFVKKNSKAIYLLPVVSLLLINFHASMWLCLFIFSMPFLVELFYLYYKQHDKRISKLIVILFISFLAGFVNPYGVKNMFYSLTSYGVDIINKEIIEMSNLTFKEPLDLPNHFFLVSIFILLSFMIFSKKKPTIRQIFLSFGIIYMAFSNFRNISIFYACVLPYLSIYLPFEETAAKEIPIKLYISEIVIVLLILGININNNKYYLKNTNQKYIDYLDKYASKDIKLYADYNNGSYFEYSGYHPYMDSRAEIFIKKNNGKEDIFDEACKVKKGTINYKKFLQKYDFDYIIVEDDDSLYYYLKKDESYQVVLKEKNKKLYKKEVK